jgi:predicted dehydrogenase
VDDLRIGVIGSGGRGGLARYAHKPGEGSRVVACCDVDGRVFDTNRAWYGTDVWVTTDYGELLRQDLDAVFVTTPDYLHEEHAVAALETGKAVYLEKPMAITIDGCDRILRTARDHRAKLYVGHNMRHFPVVLKMKELIDEGVLGQVKVAWCRHFVSYGGDAYFKDWHADRSKTTGLLLQKGAHDIDVLHWLCGGYAESVVAMGGLTLYGQIADRHKAAARGDASFAEGNWPPLTQTGLNPVVDVEDVSMMLMRLDNGVLASYQQCHYTPDAWRNYTVIGTEGRLENFGDGISEGSCIRLWNRRADRYHAEGDQVYSLSHREGGHGGGDESIVAEFLRYVRGGGPTRTSPIAARYSVATGYTATQSLRNGSMPVSVPRLCDDLLSYFAEG